MIESVEEIGESSVTTSHTVDEDAFYIIGHFPGAPVLPGAMMQEMTTQTAGILIAANFNPMANYNTHDPLHNPWALGVLVKIKHAKYRGFARPGERLRIDVSVVERVEQTFDFAGKIFLNDKAIYRNEFQLTNVPSDTLRR